MSQQTTTPPTHGNEDLIALTLRDLQDARARHDKLSADLLTESLNKLLDQYPHPAQM